MTNDLILIICAALILCSSIGILVYRRKKPEKTKPVKPNASTYSEMGYATRQLGLYSINTSPLVCLLALMMLALATAFLIAEFFEISLPGIFLIALSLSLVALFVFKELTSRKRRNFENGLIDALEIMQAASISGASPQSSLQAVAENSTGDIKKEFSAMVTSLRYGSSIDSAVARVAILYDSEGVRMLTQALITKWTAGGNLEDIMGSVARMIRERIAMRMQINGSLSGAKFAALFMGVAPYLLALFFLASQPEWLTIFLTHPAGLTLLAWAFAAQVVGSLWLRKVLRVTL